MDRMGLSSGIGGAGLKRVPRWLGGFASPRPPAGYFYEEEDVTGAGNARHIMLRRMTDMARVLVSDKLSETAVQIFRDRGVDVDYLPDLGKDKEKLAEVIGQYDGLAIRSATKVTEKLLQQASNLKVVGRAGIGVDNVDIPAASKKGVIVMNTPFGNSVTTAEHAIAMMFAVARQLPEASISTHAGKWGKNRFMGVELIRSLYNISEPTRPRGTSNAVFS